MQESGFIKIIFLFLVSALLISNLDVHAQKRKKKKDKKVIVEEPLPATPEDKRKAEMYHAEAEKYYILEDYAKAFVLYQRSLELDPADAAAYYKISQIYLKQGDQEKAIFNAERAIKLNESNKYYYLLLAEIYTKQSNFVDAATAYENMIQKCENADDYLFELAAIYIYQDDYDKALQIYDRIEQKFGINEQVIAQKQKLYLKLSKLDEAIAEGKRLIDTHPGEAKYVVLLADILISNDQSEKAIPYLEDVVNNYSDNARALLILADYYRKNGDMEKSNTYLNRAFADSELDIQPKIQVLAGLIQKLPNDSLQQLVTNLGNEIMVAHPDDPKSYEINGDLNMRLGMDEKALEVYQKAISLGSSNFGTWQNVLQTELKLGKYDDAIGDGERALELFPNQAGICWFLGSAYIAKNEFKESIEVLERGKKLAVANEELKSYFNAQLGDAYNNLKEYKKSDASYDAALAYDPDNDHVLNNYSYFLSLRKEKMDLARKMSTKLVSRNPDNATFLDTHAWVLYVLGDYAEARVYIEKALADGEISGTIMEHYGDILFKLGDVDLAVKQWQKAKGMDETSELIDKKIADRKLYE